MNKDSLRNWRRNPLGWATAFFAFVTLLFVLWQIFRVHEILVLAARGNSFEALAGLVFGTLVLTGFAILSQFASSGERRTESETRDRDVLYQTLVENSSDIVMIISLEGTITYQSPSVERILGYENGSLLNRVGFSYVHPDDISSMIGAVKQLMKGEKIEVMRECRFLHRDGSWRVLEGIAKILKSDEQGVTGILFNARDVNERRLLESKLKHQAYHDPLTNLANRTLFRNAVEDAIYQNRHKKSRIAVLFLDLDSFKNTNDTLGHDAGDKLLIEFTEALRNCVRPADIVARLGGDEFAVLIEGDELEETTLIIAKRILSNTRRSYNINNSEVKIGTSIGIAFSETGNETADDLLRNADVAMYTAKSKGKNRFVIFENVMHETLLAQIALETDLRQAIELGELTLNYQPIINLTSGHITGAEALVRWNHPEHGSVSPLEFIGIAEQTGLIIPMGHWIMREACTQSRNLHEKYGRNLTVTINISGRQLEHPNFVRDLAEIVMETGVEPDNIILELTETVMMENTEKNLQLLHQIKSLGIRLAIDDFGTGYSSLGYLQQFPIDILKIDRSFVDGIEVSSEKNAVARTIISLSETLKLATVAEGVESLEQSGILEKLGCKYGQGYYFSKPISIENLELLVKKDSKDHPLIDFSPNDPPQLESNAIN